MLQEVAPSPTPEVGSGLQYLKRKKPPAVTKPRPRKSRNKEVRKRKVESSIHAATTGTGDESPLPTVEECHPSSSSSPSVCIEQRRQLLLSLLSTHIPSVNFVHFSNLPLKNASTRTHATSHQYKTPLIATTTATTTITSPYYYNEDPPPVQWNEEEDFECDYYHNNNNNAGVVCTPPSERIFTLDTHLVKYGQTRQYISLFAEVGSYPIHPAIIDEENVDWFLYSGEAYMYPSPLGLNIAVAICVGM